MARHDADDTCLQTQLIADGDCRTDSRTEPDWNEYGVQLRNRIEELKPVRGDAAHKQRMKRTHEDQVSLLTSEFGEFSSVVEVFSVLDEFGSPGAHRQILLDAVAVRHNDGRRQSELARRESDALPVIPACGRNHTSGSGTGLSKLADQNQSAASLERADRLMIFMLHPDFRASALG